MSGGVLWVLNLKYRGFGIFRTGILGNVKGIFWGILGFFRIRLTKLGLFKENFWTFEGDLRGNFSNILGNFTQILGGFR